MKKRMLKSMFFAAKPSHLILYATNRCNLRCRTCFVNFDDNREKEMTLEEIKQIAGYLDKLIWLDISGGEPFLRSDLPEICAAFSAKSISIPTNGIERELICGAVEKIREKTNAEITIAVSLDGFKETNDSIRGEGTFDKAIGTIEKLKKIRGIRIKVNTVLSNENCEEIISFMRFIKGLNPDFHSINIRRGVSRDANLKRPSYKDLLKIKGKIFSIWNEYDYGVKKFESGILKRYQRAAFDSSLKVIKEKRQIPKCLAGKSHLVIYANGDVSSCEMLAPYGNIRKKSLAELLKSKEAIARRDFIRQGKCHCYHNCNLLDNLLLNPFECSKLLI